MRGTRSAGERVGQFRGIIPAYAGNTIHCRRTRLGDGDHPRVCGEHQPRGQSVGLRWGSSPRMRGTHAARADCRRAGGIIPAYAGNTPLSGVAERWRRDHPRVCGEHRMMAFCHIWRPGSSPRMRGTHGSYKQPFSAAGIIPAYAGNTSTPAIHTDCGGGIIPAYAGNTIFRAGSLWCVGDHPRVCGEHPG